MIYQSMAYLIDFKETCVHMHMVWSSFKDVWYIKRYQIECNREYKLLTCMYHSSITILLYINALYSIMILYYIIHSKYLWRDNLTELLTTLSGKATQTL